MECWAPIVASGIGFFLDLDRTLEDLLPILVPWLFAMGGHAKKILQMTTRCGERRSRLNHLVMVQTEKHRIRIAQHFPQPD